VRAGRALQVASIMQAVLRTLAQCHAHKILHRDIKPGNFMLLSEADDAPVKAIGGPPLALVAFLAAWWKSVAGSLLAALVAVQPTRRHLVLPADFGLAVFFDPKQLPRSDLGLEGTPWFMAPEIMSSQVGGAGSLGSLVCAADHWWPSTAVGVV
jgi:calcium-dependent protein kinase